jgi:anti-sigma factor RsiW
LLAVAASLAFLALAGWNLLRLAGQPPEQDLVARDVLAGHIRSLMVAHLTDVESDDRHTVKPWFRGKLDFAPTVPDLTRQGFRLLGGRLDYVSDRPVAAVVYRRRQHVINLFLWPAGDKPQAAPRVAAGQGYHLVHWIGGGMNCWAASDLNPEELSKFVDLVREHEPPVGH